ncbi:MAG: hypothetical protein Kow00122_08980 [Thermoleophilia bacterium]
MRVYVDTDVIVRFVTGEPPERAEAARRLFAAAADGSVELFVPAVVLVEVGFVLLRVLRMDREAAAALLASLLQAPGVVLEQREVMWRTLEVFQECPVPLVDAYLAAHALLQSRPSGTSGAPAIASFDRHFDGIAGVRRVARVEELEAERQEEP